MSLDEFSWFIGLFEGEGCVDAHRGKGDRPRLRLQVQVTDEDTVRRCLAATGRGVINGPYQRTNGRRDIWNWSVKSDDAYYLLTRMLPHLGARRRERTLEILEVTGYLPNPDQLLLEDAA